jgi:hypothetical protein
MKVQNRTWLYVLAGVLLFVCALTIVGLYAEPWVNAFANHPLRVPVWALIVCLTVLLPPAVLWIWNQQQGS